MKKIYTFFQVIFISTLSFSQVIEWQNTIGGSDYDVLKSIQQTLDGGYICGGHSFSNISGDKTENCQGGADYWVIKLNSIGNIQWQNTIGGSDWEYLNSIMQTADGGYICGGWSNSNISGDKTENSQGNYDYWVIKLDALGNIQWQNTIGGSGNDYLLSISQTFDGGYICGGSSQSNISGDKIENSQGVTDYWVIKLDANGNIQWQNTIGGSSHDHLRSINQTSDGGYILGGLSDSNISGDKIENSQGVEDYWVIKLDSLGNIQWQNTIGGNYNDNLFSISQTVDGGYICGGYSASNISGDKTENSQGVFDYWVIKLDGGGNIIWQNTIGGDSDDFLESIAQTLDGEYICGGRSQSNISGDKIENSQGGYDYWVLKLDALGNILWQNTIGGSNSDELYSISPISDGEYICGGYSFSNISGDKTENVQGYWDFWVVKLIDNNNLNTGKVYLDLNSNNIHEPMEPTLSHQLVNEISSGRFSFSEQNGNYSVSVFDTGNFSVSPSPVVNYTPVPVSHSAYFSAMNQIDSLNDFAFQPNGAINDLQVTINPLSPFRPGFNVYYNIHYKNVGTVSLPATIIFYPDTNLTFVSANPLPTSVTLDSVVWNIPAINPFDVGNILVTVNVDASTPIGIWINSQAGVEPISGDANPLDNIASWRVEATGSYDPNDILVSREAVYNYELSSPPFLEYIVRFQNTGTDTAFTVKIKNPLPVNSQLNTIEFINSSHPVQLNYNNDEQVLWFEFNNILLPDSNTNELLSHGFVRYRINFMSE